MQIGGVQDNHSQKNEVKSTWVPPEKFPKPHLESTFNFFKNQTNKAFKVNALGLKAFRVYAF